MRRAALAVLLVLGAGACRRFLPPKAPKAAAAASAAGFALTDFDQKLGEYTCRAPAAWRVLEDPVDAQDVMFFGPPRVSISIGRYDGRTGPVKTPQDYYKAAKRSGAKVGPLSRDVVGGRAIYRLSEVEPVRYPNSPKVLYLRRADVALIPAKTGFYAVEHRAPEDGYRATLPVFEAVVDSLKPRG
ncbi:MAG: hypothetical protein KGM24_03440 [Elusimicrobia bacterium]|nr:hypothetical protein [Elusimicrobiota bacterium]